MNTIQSHEFKKCHGQGPPGPLRGKTEVAASETSPPYAQNRKLSDDLRLVSDRRHIRAPFKTETPETLSDLILKTQRELQKPIF